ncbi:PREDICTED: uncharacterized protein LOC108746126 [Trachymyrmex septentrionalis]|uniref:uncharacterized protein LOC108746126 n=1 Tax=Trachymyrmex septentrionalis TaxID=34720 RepID=UPI00084F2C6E|nr:PREDICTED: uncharacterized protein LOC108746126 [Trachymyrmex septentrionalis]
MGVKNFTVENGVYKGEEMHQSTKYKSLGELMWVSITSHEDKIAHLDARTDETFTYTELQDKAVRCALWLQKQGIKCGDVISVCTSNQPNSIVPCIAAAYVNAIFNPWNEDMDLPTALHVLQLTTPKVIFCSEKSVSVILNAMKEKNYNPMVVVFGNHDSAISLSDILRNCNNAEAANFRYVELDDVKKTACIMHSSGTTGMPKGVELSNHTMILMKDNSTLDMTNVPTLWFSSLYWISGVLLNVKAISQGATVILYSQFDEDMTCQLIEKYKVAVLFLSSSMINRFVRAGYVKNYSLLSLKVILGGGAIIKPKVQKELRHYLPHVQILQGYGMTEVGGLVTCQLPNHKDGSCGVVAKNVQIKIVTPESGKVLDPNQSGEIWIKSATMMNGYYRNPEATKSTIDEEGWLHTGDIGYIDEDGELFIIDRIKELIKYRGYQISPGEIEGVLISHPAVLEAAVISIPHATDDEHPLAYITKKPGAKLDARTEETVTYAELQDKVVKCALWLQKQGIKSDDIISVCTGNHCNSIVPCLSAVYINVIFNPWDENMNLKTALYVLRMIMPKVIFCSEKSVDVILSAIKEQNCNPTIVVFGKHVDAISFSDILSNCSNVEVANFHYIDQVDITKTACILHSSGTSGMPKGVELSNYALLHVSQNETINTTNAVFLWFSSLYWISGIVLNLITIVQGGKVIVYPEFNEEMTCRLIEKYQIEIIFLSTSLLSRFLKASCIKKYSLSSLKVILYGGAIMNKKVQEDLKYILPHIQILQGYGMTETGGPITSPQSHNKNGSNGVVAKNVQIKIVDPESGVKILESNQSGEIWIKSTTMMTGYYKNPEATRSAIDEEDARTEETVTYAELQNKVVRCALWLQKKGIKSGDVISMCTGNHLNSIVPCLSATYINAIFNPWNENMDLQTALYFLQLMMPKMIFCSEKSVNIILSAIKKQNCNVTVVVFGKHVDAVSFYDILKNCNDVEVTNFRYIELDNIKKTVCIMHSSGTTGMPKGVELSNYAMLFISLQYELNLTNVPSLWFSTIYWITGILMSFSGIIQNTKAIIYPEFDEEMTCRLIQKYKIDTVFLSTNMMARLHQSGYIQKYPLPSLKTVVFGGAPIRSKVQKELRHLLPHVQILQCYGMTELGSFITIQLPNHKNGSCGAIVKNGQIKVVDPETGKVLNPNQSGEIWLKLPSIMTGYYKNSEATKNTIDKDEVIKCGGSLLKTTVQEDLRHVLPHVQILQCYGMTEAGGIVTMQQPHNKNGSCGVLVENVQMKIVDPESGKVLGPNQSGEIWMKVPSLMNGYYRNPEATKNIIDNEGWLHSGDIGYIDGDGELFIIDRIKELIKYRGYQISPGEIENILLLHPAVLEAAIIGVPHTLDDEHPLAYITKKPGVKVTEQELIDFVAKNMEDRCKLRGGVIFLDSFPYTGSGKISKKDLKAMTRKLVPQNK